MLLKIGYRHGIVLTIIYAIIGGGCTIHDVDSKATLSAARLIATPPSHYSTQKARHLGQKYQEKLEHLIDMIASNRITSKLQFANNLGSSGGIGFFTHSAVKVPDERFLEVVLGTGEHLEGADYSVKLARLFSLYGRELLVMLASDREIYNDREMSGYGLNFSWRSRDSRANRERAIVYFSKEKVRAFLQGDIDGNTLLADAVIFVIEPEGQARLLSFRPQDPAPDVRTPIKEQVLVPEPSKEEPEIERLLAKGRVNRTELIKPMAHAEESSDGQKDTWLASSKSETAPKQIDPDPKPALQPEEEIVRVDKIGPVMDENTEPVGTPSSGKSDQQSQKTSTPARGIVETTQPGPRAWKSSLPEVGAEAPQAKLQQKKSEGTTPELSSVIEVPRKQNNLHLDLPDFKPPALSEGLPPNEALKPKLEVQALPAPGSTEVRLYSAKTPERGSEVETVIEIASITKRSPKTAHTEMAVPATPSGLENAEADSVEKHSGLAHAKPMENMPETNSFTRPVPKSLEGYIIQVAFKDRSEARSWADTFEQRGYAVSLTEAGGGESLRVRIGNFRLRDHAERQLKSIREDGLMGIILNLPQAYRPEVRSSLP